MDRVAHLNKLLSMSAPESGLAQFAWDTDTPLVELQAAHIANALSKFLAGEVSASEIESWANAIECRDDVGYQPQSSVGAVLHELANPRLTQSLSQAPAKRLMASLQGDAT
jgi:hypothetical protein